MITGDIFDRGPDVLPALWLLHRLEKEAKEAGGGVHLLLGNHEVMVLNGDLRYLHPKYHKVSEVFEKNYEDLFSDQSVLGQWLRSRPVLIKINDAIFAHGGFHPHLAEQNLTLQHINQTFKSALVASELSKPRAGLAEVLA